MGCDGSLYNGKSQSGSAALPAAGAVTPEEGFPEMGEILSGDREPVIADRKAGPAGFLGQGKADLTASGAVAQGVGEEIPHHFPEPFPVAGEREFRQISGQVDLLLLQLEFQRLQYLPDQPGKLQRFPMQSCPGFQPGEFQQPPHQLCHAVAFLQYDAKVLLPLLRENVLPEGFGVGAQDSQRGFQLMRRSPGEFPLPAKLPGKLILRLIEGSRQGVELGDGAVHPAVSGGGL